MKQIKLLDLVAEHTEIQDELNAAINKVISTADFIKGNAVSEFEENLGKFLGGAYVIGVGNGTDALQIALMSIGVGPGDEVIIPGFTYIATAEAICLVGATPVLVDVKESDFTIDPELIKVAITSKTKAIIPVHIYGQPCDMELIMSVAKVHDIQVIEDNAQALGAEMKINGQTHKTSTIGDLGCLSFFPSKNLGAFGDGGAVVTKNKELAHKVRMIANHGQVQRCNHDVLGMNSRLDAIQAAVLNIKLTYLDKKNQCRLLIANFYSESLKNNTNYTVPPKEIYGRVYHQYTLKVHGDNRDRLQKYLLDQGVPSRIYYPIPVHLQKSMMGRIKIGDLSVTENLTHGILSIPIHPQLDTEQMTYIAKVLNDY